MALDQRVCADNISSATLSAWRDGLLSAAETQRIVTHVAGCRACEERVRQFEEVGQVLRSQRELEPRDRIVVGVRQRAVQQIGPRQRRHWQPRGPIWNGVKALAPVAAIVLLFLYVMNGGLWIRTYPQGKTTPSAMGTPGSVTVAAPTIAHELSYAYEQANEVWVSLAGEAPHQVTHLQLGNQALRWEMVWSADRSRLLASAGDSGWAHERDWVITLPDGPVVALSSAFAGCGEPSTCHWLGDHSLLYNDFTRSTAHAFSYHVYDTQTQRALVTALDNQLETEVEVRGGSIYFSPYVWSRDGTPLRGTIQRFDLATDRISTVYTVLGELVTQGIPSGEWDLSADGRSALVVSRSAPTLHCPVASCDSYVMSVNGAISPVFLRHQQAFPGQDAVIAPDGWRVAELIGGAGDSSYGIFALQVAQQDVTNGEELTNSLPAATGRGGDRIIGWTVGAKGALVQRALVDASGDPLVTSLYDAPDGQPGTAALLVETIRVAGQVAFAPPPLSVT